MSSKAEQLFEVEATLRLRATQLDPEKRPSNVTPDQARKNLRVAALAYARIATEISDCFDEAT